MNRVKTRHADREPKDIVVGAKVPSSLLSLIDEEAQRDGTSRSHIIRRRLLESYRNQAIKAGA